MDVLDAARLTAASIRTHKTRTALSALGVVLGIAAVISLVTVGAGVSESITRSIGGQFDATAIVLGVQPLSQGFGGNGGGADSIRPYTDRDLAELAKLPDAASVDASVTMAGAEVRFSNQLVQGFRVVARTGAYAPALEEGIHPIGPNEALVTRDAADTIRFLVREGKVVGSAFQLRLPGNQTAFLRIVGIEQSTGLLGSGVEISVPDHFVPASNVSGRTTRLWETVTLHAPSPDRVPALKEQATEYLNGQSDARSMLGGRYALHYQTQADLANVISSSIGQFTLFLSAIGAVSLVVGLVGIANIMLVAVSERTREIGVMKATGAKRGEIILVFLVEAVAICVVGAIVGVVAGSLMGWGLGQLIGQLSESGPVPFVFLGEWYATAVGLGVLTGILAGLYPAWRAARVSPVEALRYE